MSTTTDQISTIFAHMNRTMVPTTSSSPDDGSPVNGTDFMGPIFDSNSTDYSQNFTIPRASDDWLPSEFLDLYDRFVKISGHEWIIFGIIALASVLVIALVIGICCWICQHKKRVIERRDEPIVSEYEDGYSWPKCFSCCCRKRRSLSRDEKQGSPSNMNPYKRPPPLPPIGGYESAANQDGFTGSYIPPNQRLPPLEKQGFIFDPTDSRLGMNITGIRNIPSTKVPENQLRPLPQLEKF